MRGAAWGNPIPGANSIFSVLCGGFSGDEHCRAGREGILRGRLEVRRIGKTRLGGDEAVIAIDLAHDLHHPVTALRSIPVIALQATSGTALRRLTWIATTSRAPRACGAQNLPNNHVHALLLRPTCAAISATEMPRWRYSFARRPARASIEGLSAAGETAPGKRTSSVLLQGRVIEHIQNIILIVKEKLCFIRAAIWRPSCTRMDGRHLDRIRPGRIPLAGPKNSD